MADRGDTHYHVSTLNKWFLLSSFLLLASIAWMVLDDWAASWKDHQRKFFAMDAEKAREELAAQEMQAALADEERLAAVVGRAESELEDRRAQIEPAQKELRLKKAELDRLTDVEKAAKQEYNWEKYVYEEEVLHARDAGQQIDPALRERFREFEAALNAATAEREGSEAIWLEAKAEVDAAYASITDAEQTLASATKDLDLLRTKLNKLDPDAAPEVIANAIRDFPGLDFVDPKYKVRKVVPADLTVELNFMRGRRIDMCETCHLGMERPDFEDAPQPYAPHPRLDLYLSARSPHPYNDFGCTICHRGAGEALDFIRADHRPDDEAEKAAWQNEHHWHKQHHWDWPMLPAKYTEAGCVQCHTTSMELIADEAPDVSRGYELFERYGCYACHKVEWFPTQRRPGPSLKNMQAKLEPDWVASWIARPREFRPTTWMPQVFHLENYAPEQVIVAAPNWGEESEPILGQSWNDTAVRAVTEFILARAPEQPLPPLPVEGDPLRGKEVFRLTGCLACHNLAPYEEGEEPVRDPAMMVRETNDHGPNLRGVATKIKDPRWLYWWIKDPTAYWPETRMPDLRLSDQDAADVTAYILEGDDEVFRDVPEGWEPAMPDFDRRALEEQARWFFLREGRQAINQRFEGEWADDEALLVAVGEHLVRNHGCYSCHEIAGLENEMPIGAELTNWASKTVDKLDFGFLPSILARENDWDFHERKAFLGYREPWLEQKLHAPRSYDREKIKNPLEKLKMPWFGFEPNEIESIVTFVAGLVDDEVERAKMVPDEGQAAMDAGLRAIRQKNCMACHVVEPGRVEWTDEEGQHHDVAAQFRVLDDEFIPPPMDPERWAKHLEAYEAFQREEDPEFVTESAYAQLWEPAPDLGLDANAPLVLDPRAIEVHPPRGGDFVEVVADYYINSAYNQTTADPDGEGKIEDVDGQWRFYGEEEYEKLRWTFAPPVLIDQGNKVHRDWFYAFLEDPFPVREQIRVRMPTFTYDEGGEDQAAAIADYFAYAAKRDWPATFARKLRLHLGKSVAEIAEGAGLLPDAVRGIENGVKPDIEAGFEKLMSYAREQGFTEDRDWWPSVDPRYEQTERRSPAHIAAQLAEMPDHFERAEYLALDTSGEGVHCGQCHFVRGARPPQDPIAWAPDLYGVRERLREEWTHAWLQAPSLIYPGTAMPANFQVPNQWQAAYPGSPAEQIGAVLDWLYNMDSLPRQ